MLNFDVSSALTELSKHLVLMVAIRLHSFIFKLEQPQTGRELVWRGDRQSRLPSVLQILYVGWVFS